MLKCKYVVFGLVISIFSLQQLVAEELNIYSHRQPFLIQPFLDAFTQKTGIKTNVLYSSKGLAQRLRSEGRNSPADVVLTVDIGRLYIYRDLGLLAVVNSDKMLENVPSHMRAADNTWFALSKRSRVIITAKDRVGTDEIKKIEDLADPKWKGRICSRPGSHVYNRALMASVIAHHGAERAEEWAVGLVNNFARRPQGNDRAQVKAIYEGVCDVGIINNYYFGKLKFSEDENQRVGAKAMNLTFPEVVNKFNINKQNLEKNFNKIKQEMFNNLMKKITPIVELYMSDNSISIVIDKKNVFIAKSNYDITNKIIDLINK